MNRYWLDDTFKGDTTPMEGTVFVGVIEWGSDSGEDPAVTLALTVEDIERWYRRRVIDALAIEDDDPVPPPADAPHDEIVAWMEEWREANTGAWLTVFRRPIPAE